MNRFSSRADDDTGGTLSDEVAPARGSVADAAQRIDYFDNLRILAMTFGIFVHTATLANFGPIEIVPVLSDAFRMAIFFVVSGSLGALLLSRQGVRTFLAGRLRNLGIPLVAALVTLNPVTFFLVFGYFKGWDSADASNVIRAFLMPAQGEQAQFVWHLHLWFLFSLISFVLCAAAILRPLRSTLAMIERLRLPAPALRLLMFTGVVGASLALKAMSMALAGAGWQAPWLVDVTLRYLPFYIAGMALWLCPWLRAAVVAPSPVLGGLAWGAYAVAALAPLEAEQRSQAFVVIMPMVRWWCCAVLLWLGSRWLDFRSPLTEFLSRSIYTLYLAHYLIIYALANTLKAVMPIGIPAYFLIAFATVGIGLWLHATVVAKSQILTVLYNGRSAPKPPAGDTSATTSR